MIFNKTKYTKWYYQIVDNALNRSTSGYTERHHIVPKCFFEKYNGTLTGNPDDKNNLVDLTPREHFICHWLLIKMTSGKQYYQMVNALRFFIKQNYGVRDYKLNSKTYDYIKKRLSTAQSERLKGRKITWNDKLSLANLGRSRSKDSINKQQEKMFKTWVFTSPTGSIYRKTGDFRKICIELGLNPKSLQTSRTRGRIPSKGQNKGWVVTTE